MVQLEKYVVDKSSLFISSKEIKCTFARTRMTVSIRAVPETPPRSDPWLPVLETAINKKNTIA